MKFKHLVFIPLILVSLFFVFPSCSKDSDPATGTLTVYVVDSVGKPMTNQKLFLARTYKDISDTTYVATNWTDAEGKFTFGDLVPGYYWYRIQNWKNLGAYRVYAGIDGYTIFLVDKPDPHK